jgi:hypothetical protein
MGVADICKGDVSQLNGGIKLLIWPNWPLDFNLFQLKPKLTLNIFLQLSHQ